MVGFKGEFYNILLSHELKNHINSQNYQTLLQPYTRFSYLVRRALWYSLDVMEQTTLLL